MVSPAWADSGLSPRAAFAQAAERVMDAARNLDRAPAVASRDLGADAGAGEPVSNTSRARYLEMVETAKEYIRAGDIFQVVPSQRWAQPFALPPFALYRALRRTNPSPYMFYFDFGGFQVVGASPEILVRVKGDTVTVRPIAGTRPRGATPAEDACLEAELLADPKERAEHLMLLDLGRNDVGRVARIGTVDPNEQFIIERYSHVMHIVSNVDGKLAEGADALAALLAGLPAGTVSGAPKVRAMQIIDELEAEKRGVYGGGVGYFAAGGDMDVCIALRTGVVKDGTLYVQSGGGVVADSDPEAEFQETVSKARRSSRPPATPASSSPAAAATDRFGPVPRERQLLGEEALLFQRIRHAPRNVAQSPFHLIFTYLEIYLKNILHATVQIHRRAPASLARPSEKPDFALPWPSPRLRSLLVPRRPGVV